MKHIPNFITFSRIILSIALLFVYTQPTLFFLIYFLAGITDLIDGFLARRYRLQTRLGSTLDSIADILMFFVCLFILVISKNEFPIWLYVAIAIIAAIRIINIVITRLRFRRFAILHSTMNKYTGFALWVFYPWILYANDYTQIFIAVIVVMAFISSIEEFLIVTHVVKYDVNQKRFRLSSNRAKLKSE